MAEEYAQIEREQLTCGCHVHVGVGSRDEAVGSSDRIRPWLHALAAISANSPFWQGRDTGYSSWRTQVWQRWPAAGPTEVFGSADSYDEVIAQLLAAGGIMDLGMLYFDARPSEHVPTLEVRVSRRADTDAAREGA